MALVIPKKKGGGEMCPNFNFSVTAIESNAFDIRIGSACPNSHPFTRLYTLNMLCQINPGSITAMLWTFRALFPHHLWHLLLDPSPVGEGTSRNGTVPRVVRD